MEKKKATKRATWLHAPPWFVGIQLPSKQPLELARNIGVVMGSTAPYDTYLLFYSETLLPNGVRAFLYTIALAYCFIGLSAITARFFKSMESIMKHSREVVSVDPRTNEPVVKHEKVWNYTIADIALLAFGTSFPQISLATIDAIRNLDHLTAGGVGPYVIVFTALAAGTSWSDLVASKIAAERQVTADSAIANITCSNSVNIYVGIGVPWLIDTVYNFFVYQEPLYIDNAAGLSFSLQVFFATSFGS